MQSHEPVTVSDRSQAARNLAIGSIIFAVVLAIALRYLAIYHKSLVWMPDGAAQHFPSLYYLNQIVRQFLHDPGHGFPFWSWRLGLGADTIGTLSFYVVGDPFVPISLLFPMSSMELAFTVIYIVRIASAGLFSAVYLRKMGASPFSALLGSLAYCFTTFLLFFTVHHSLFGTALALFPLLLLGVEYSLDHRRSWVLVLAVFLSAASNFYFFYMAALTLAIYIAARYFETTPREDRWRRLAPDALRIAGCVALGTLLAAPVLFPSIAAVFATARRQTPFAPPTLFSAAEYGQYLASLVSTVIGPNSTVLGFAPLGLVLVPALFMRRGNTALKVMLVAFPLIVASPFLSAVYNGFTFPSGRFGFQWGLFLALAVALLLADSKPFASRELRGMAAAYLMLWAAVFALNPPSGAVLAVPFAIGVGTWCVFGLEWLLARRQKVPAGEGGPHSASAVRGDWRLPATRWAVLGVLVIGIFSAGTLLYDRRFGNGLSNNLDAGKVLAEYQQNPGSLSASIPDGSFYRVQNSSPRHYNDALVQGGNPTAYYFSLMNGNLTKFLLDNAICTGWSSFSFGSLDDRVALDEITAVKYYTVAPSRASYVPYGFDLVSQAPMGRVYRNQFALPLGFVYDRVISRADFDAMPVVARQQAMLEGAVVEDDADVALPSITPSATVIDLPYSIASTSGVVVDLAAGRITKLADTNRVDLRFSAPVGSELYLQLTGLSDVESASAGVQRPTQTWTSFDVGGQPKTVRFQTTGSPYYWGDTTQLVNLGYHSSPVTTAAVGFRAPGTVSFDSLKVLAVPMNAFAARVASLRANPMRSIRVANNSVSGETDSPRPGLLFLSIPFSSGWHSTVDGRPAKVLRVNTAFSGIPIPAGKHTVDLRYATPGFAAGLLAAAAALALCACLLVVARNRRRREAQASS